MSWLDRLRSLERKSDFLEKGTAKTAKSPFYSSCSASSQGYELSHLGDKDRGCEVTTTINADPAPSPSSAATDPSRCAHCGEGEHSGAMILPFGNSTADHTWLHGGCWREWCSKRRAADAAEEPR